jgi:hypothetical protein
MKKTEVPDVDLYRRKAASPITISRPDKTGKLVVVETVQVGDEPKKQKRGITIAKPKYGTPESVAAAKKGR